ncbi:MAG: helix-turn-helix transcriptional regulator [Clostridia bacterium]
MDYRSLGLRIKGKRKELHLTQDKLAESVGISMSFLGHIERGTRKASLETVVAIANALSVSADTLLQESINDHSLLGIPCNTQQRIVLREISKILHDNPDAWSD